MTSPNSRASQILELASRAGFDLASSHAAEPSRTADRYRQWVANGFHGEMAYLARPDAVDRRADPALVLPGVRTVVTVGLNYYTSSIPSHLVKDPARGIFARFSWGADYHHLLLARLKALAQALGQGSQEPFTWRAYVDTGPLLERELAAVGGLGFIGKNTSLINRRLGSWVFLGELLLTADVRATCLHDSSRETLAQPGPQDADQENAPSSNAFNHREPAVEQPRTVAGSGNTLDETVPTHTALHRLGTCGQCTRCLDACPTGALVAPYILDARRCISYLTIELKGAIPRDLRTRIGNRIFGCDICQEVCPWNRRFATPTSEPAFWPRAGRMAPLLLSLLSLDDEEFNRQFRGTPVQRTKRRGLARNVAVALGNWGHPQAIPALVEALYDQEPLVRQHSAWALGQIAARQREHREAIAVALSKAQLHETDPSVLVELTGSSGST